MTGELPYAGLLESQILVKVYDYNSLEGPIDDWDRYPQLEGPIKDLLKDCWSWLPSARPTMSAVVGRLTTSLNHTTRKVVPSQGFPCGRPPRDVTVLGPIPSLFIIVLGSTVANVRCYSTAAPTAGAPIYKAYLVRCHYSTPLVSESYSGIPSAITSQYSSQMCR